jgi:hypothetical protein
VPFVPTPSLALGATTLQFENCFSTNGVIDPGETVTMSFALTNSGSAGTTNLVVTLLATNGITAPSGPQTYGIISAGGATVSRAFTFTASGSCGGNVTPVLQLQDGSANLGSVSRVFALGNISIGTQSFTNSGNINILDNAAASPYPSSITVSIEEMPTCTVPISRSRFSAWAFVSVADLKGTLDYCVGDELGGGMRWRVNIPIDIKGVTLRDRAVVAVVRAGSGKSTWTLSESDADQLESARRAVNGSGSGLRFDKQESRDAVPWTCPCDCPAVQAACGQICPHGAAAFTCAPFGGTCTASCSCK